MRKLLIAAALLASLSLGLLVIERSSTRVGSQTRQSASCTVQLGSYQLQAALALFAAPRDSLLRHGFQISYYQVRYSFLAPSGDPQRLRSHSGNQELLPGGAQSERSGYGRAQERYPHLTSGKRLQVEARFDTFAGPRSCILDFQLERAPQA